MIAIALALQIAAAQPDTAVALVRPTDSWFAEDKFKHFATSYAVTAFAYAGGRAFFEDDESRVLAIASGAVAGILKEFHDRSRGGPFSLRDIVWDAAGIALGFVIVKQIR